MPDKNDLFIRNVIFGVCDSLVSTVGLLSGIDIGGTTQKTIILTGLVYTFVEAFSMSIGSFLSEQSVEEYDMKGSVDGKNSLSGGVIMFVSFILASFVPIFPYIVFPIASALWISIAFSIVTLFIVGLLSARVAKIRMAKQGIRMALLGGMAIIIGVIVGKLFK
jgi:VIT1/CCC1 family predicted Fe2+/Mn2+ transporter